MIRASIPPRIFNKLAKKTAVFTDIKLDNNDLYPSVNWRTAWLEEDLEYPTGENKTGRVVEVNSISTKHGTYLSPTDRDIMWSI